MDSLQNGLLRAAAVFAHADMIVHNSAEDTVQPHRTLHDSSGALVIDPLVQVVKRTMQEDRTETASGG